MPSRFRLASHADLTYSGRPQTPRNVPVSGSRRWPNLVATIARSRQEPVSARPTSFSFPPTAYMSAVSIRDMPISRARWIVRIDSASFVAPYHSVMPMQPRPIASTSRPCLPSSRFSPMPESVVARASRR